MGFEPISMDEVFTGLFFFVSVNGAERQSCKSYALNDSLKD